MRKFYIVFFGLFLCIDCVNAAGRAQNNTVQINSRQTITRQRNEGTQNRTISQRAATISDSVRKTQSRKASNKIITGRTAIKTSASRTATRPALVVSRAGAAVHTKAFGNNYNACRDAYFTCMDQFCATLDET
ncbi:MAG: hypothetical protein IK122_00085, partial [Alphaproteobacteria bacterium]|nr:hypothetical protein [Alphaproteobacteria bacterium]